MRSHMTMTEDSAFAGLSRGNRVCATALRSTEQRFNATAAVTPPPTRVRSCGRGYRERVPAEPSDRGSPPALEPHRARQMAESFGSDPARYDRARPRYPETLVARIIASSPGTEILDVGCGTGIASRQFEAAGCRICGVEPDARMAAFARSRGVRVEVASFEGWDPAGRAFDAVLAGQAWHWVDPVAGAAKAAQVLRPQGRLAAFWNVFQAPPEIAEAFSEVYQRVVPEWPRNPWARPGLEAYAPILERAADGMRASGRFTDPEQWRFDWERAYDRDEWLEQMATGGDASQFSPPEREALLALTGATIDAMGGSFKMPYTAVVLTAAYASA